MDMVVSFEEEFPPLPISPEGTPCKEPAHKKAHVVQGEEKSGNEPDVIKTLSDLINTRFDAANTRFDTVEKLVNDNSVKIEGLKKSIDFAFDEIKDVKKKGRHD